MSKILYIEDNLDTANAMKIILENVGYDIHIANDGRTGVEKALLYQWDLIMLDIMLPDMSGWEIYQMLKPQKETKYIFVSTIPASPDRIQQIKEDGISAYIMKPFSKEDLLIKLKQILDVEHI